MARWIPALLLVWVAPLLAQDQKDPQTPPPPKKQDELKKERPQPATSDKEEVPPEEDTSVAVDNFTYNPLLSQKNVRVGNYYFKKSNYRAAANRFRYATKYDDGNTEAWLRLGEASEKIKDTAAAKEAYTKYLALAPNEKEADEIRKKLKKLK